MVQYAGNLLWIELAQCLRTSLCLIQPCRYFPTPATEDRNRWGFKTLCFLCDAMDKVQKLSKSEFRIPLS
jgi:hypothetical protein